MKASSIYSTIAKSAAIAAVAVTALVGATSVQARPYYIQEVQYVQVAPQVVITPPQLIIQAPVRPVHVAPVYTNPVVVQQVVNHPHRFIPGRIYYINGRAYLNGHRFYGKRGNGHRHGHGNGYGHGHQGDRFDQGPRGHR
jgi:hypothetical protein